MDMLASDIPAEIVVAKIKDSRCALIVGRDHQATEAGPSSRW
jgi:hypothetical protein